MARDVLAARDAARLAAAAASRAARWAVSSRPARAAAAAAAASRAARSAVPVASRVAREIFHTARFSYPHEHRLAKLRARGAPPPRKTTSLILLPLPDNIVYTLVLQTSTQLLAN